MNKINIGIIGLGLIGSSLAQALNLHSNKYNILGFTTNLNTVKKAPFACYTDYKNISQCDVIFTCSPLSKIIEIIKNIKPYIINKNTIITDVGSVKSQINTEAKEILKDTCIFIGGHPMAGTEYTGYDAGFASLFENKLWILLQKNKILQEIIKDAGANTIITDSKSHDKAAALISHMPALLSLQLQTAFDNIENTDPELYKLATQMSSTGFASMTRLAQNPELIDEFLKFNKANMQAALELVFKTKI